MCHGRSLSRYRKNRLAKIQIKRANVEILFRNFELMQTRSLKTLTHIAKVGSFAKAAEHLNMTLSALSMQMKSLENELGVTLFDRSVRPPRMTPIGRAIVAEAIPMLACEDKLIEICKPGTALVGKFRLGFVTSAAVRLLPDFIELANENAPQATFDFETGLSKDLQSKVMNGLLDAAVVTDADSLPKTSA
jgi:DNA-binding transcriptional LysR family regulator